jgi:tetrahydromethanopterin S-methyltransferase subunit H
MMKYNVHYVGTHVVGTTGSTTENMREYLDLVSTGQVDPAFMISHVGGINAVIDTTLNLPTLPGAKKLIYNHIEMPLTAINDLEKLGESNPSYAQLAELVAANNGLWGVEAEKFLLANSPA